MSKDHLSNGYYTPLWDQSMAGSYIPLTSAHSSTGNLTSTTYTTAPTWSTSTVSTGAHSPGTYAWIAAQQADGSVTIQLDHTKVNSFAYAAGRISLNLSWKENDTPVTISGIDRKMALDMIDQLHQALIAMREDNP